MSVARGIGGAYTPNYTIDQILQSTQVRQPGSRFRQVFGGIVGGATNLVAPGLGTAIGGMISGGRLNSTGLMGETTQFLELQRAMQMEARAFETASTVMKMRHDASMSAIRNMKG